MPRKLDETWQLLEDFAEAARLLQVNGDNDGEVLPALCQLSSKLVGGDHASVTTMRRGTFATVAATSDVPERADQLQYEKGQGPCLDAIRESTTIRVDDLAVDPRWPTFGRLTSARLGLRSMLAHVLPVAEDTIGALNVYAARPMAFTEEHETLLSLFGTIATLTLRGSHKDVKAEQLERALHTSRHIGVALGIIMATRKVTLEESWELLAKLSQDNNLKVSVLSEHVIATGLLEAP